MVVRRKVQSPTGACFWTPSHCNPWERKFQKIKTGWWSCFCFHISCKVYPGGKLSRSWATPFMQLSQVSCQTFTTGLEVLVLPAACDVTNCKNKNLLFVDNIVLHCVKYALKYHFIHHKQYFFLVEWSARLCAILLSVTACGSAPSRWADRVNPSSGRRWISKNPQNILSAALVGLFLM